jgi:FAD/FMN-containing dehydrogenase
VRNSFKTPKQRARSVTLVSTTIRNDRAARAEAADDFGHLVHHTPDVVLRPMSNQDVAAAIRRAAGQGRRFAAQGQRHSVFGRGQVDGGIVADMTGMHTVHDVGDDRVTVGAGATWRKVLAATLPSGCFPPAVPDYLDLSVGGTLAVGGVGARISAFGAQTDNVVELQVVTGNGEEVTCSADRRADLFDAVRAGLGQVAVVTTATLTLVPAPRQVHRLLLFYPDLPTMLHDQRLLVVDGRFDAVQGAVLPAPDGGWTFRLDAVVDCATNPPDDAALLDGLSADRDLTQSSTSTHLEHLARLDALEQALRAHGMWDLPHPWLMTFVGDSAVESVVSAELDRLTPSDLGPFGQVSLSAFRSRSVTSPMLRLPTDDVCHAVNLVRIPTTDSTAEAARLVAANRAAYDRVRAAGGALYPVSALPMSPDDWRTHFGPVFAQLAAAKRRYDPGHVLTPGYEVFRT